LFDLGPRGLIEHLEQWAGALSGLQGRASQGGHARDGVRPRNDLQQPPRHAQTDPFGLGDSGELVLGVGGDLDGLLQPLVKGLNLGVLLSDLVLECVDL
jgi:hypothetical protein